MKRLLPILLALSLCIAPCQAQFGGLGGLLKGAKAVNDARKTKKKVQKTWGNTKVKDIYKDIAIDSVKFKKALAEAEQRMYENNPELKKLMEMQGDTVALKKYYEEKYGGMSQEEMTKKMLEEAGVDYNSLEFQAAYAKAQNMAGVNDDPVFKKVMEEQRQPTMEEATYLNEKYGTNFEYEGIEAYNDSIGVFAHIDGKLKPMGITKYETITDEKPVLDFGQDEIKWYVQDYISFLKKPLADREIVDSVQNYMIYKNRHADEQFKGLAQFTLYSNLEINVGELTINDLLQRRISDFTDPIDPNNIFVFKVHKGFGYRYMEYMYSKISYKQSELIDYISQRLINEGYIDANINQKLSDEDLFMTINKMEFQFKVEKLLNVRKNNEKFLYTNAVPAAKGVNITSKVRKVGGHVTALDVNIEAEPGEYAFIIRKPEVEELQKHLADNEEDENGRKKALQNFDISILTQGAYFFTVE